MILILHKEDLIDQKTKKPTLADFKDQYSSATILYHDNNKFNIIQAPKEE